MMTHVQALAVAEDSKQRLENPTADSSVNPEAPHPVLLADRPVSITPIKAAKTKSKKTAPAPTKVAGAAKTPKVKAASADTSVKAAQRKNSMPSTDAELIASITQHVSDADKFSAQAGVSSIKALNRYKDIGQAVLDEKRLGKFQKPQQNIKDWCNEHLAGVIGASKPYGMVGLCMSLAKMWGPLSAELKRRDAEGTPVGPLGLQAALKLARQLSKAGDAEAKPKTTTHSDLNSRVRETLKGLAADYAFAIKAKMSPRRLEASLIEIAEVARLVMQKCERGFD